MMFVYVLFNVVLVTVSVTNRVSSIWPMQYRFVMIYLVPGH